MSMSRWRPLLCLIPFLLLSMSVCGQGLKLGVKGGYNMTSMSLNKDVLKPSGKDGFFVGPSLKLSFPFGLGFDLAGLYDECKVKVSGEELNIRSIKVPVNLRANIGLGRVCGFYMAAGPEFSFALGKTHKLDNIESFENFVHKESYYNVNVGMGFYLTSHVEVGALYSIAVGNNGKFESTEGDACSADTRTSVWRLSAAIYF